LIITGSYLSCCDHLQGSSSQGSSAKSGFDEGGNSWLHLKLSPAFFISAVEALEVNSRITTFI
jgi:hypothetical protein